MMLSSLADFGSSRVAAHSVVGRWVAGEDVGCGGQVASCHCDSGAETTEAPSLLG